MLSYAQNFEDVILTRALQEIKFGHYIDIGAYHPVKDSVSLAFYQRGWRGTHVEPNPQFAALLREARPDEIVIEAACSTSLTPVSFSVVSDTGLSTGVSSIASKHGGAGFPLVQIEVPTVSLNSILQLWENRTLHWLKVDVEGMEEDALRSWGDSTARPWICVIESTEPNSPTQNHHLWEHHLIERGYIFAYFDGLNRYYLHEDRIELLGRFGPGANVFDLFSITEFSPFAGHILELRNAEAEKASDLKRKLFESADKLRAEHVKITELARDLEASRQLLLSERKKLEIEIQRGNLLVSQLNDMNIRVTKEVNDRRKVELLLRSTTKANLALQTNLDRSKRYIEQMEDTYTMRFALVVAKFAKIISGMTGSLKLGDKQRSSKSASFLECRVNETAEEGLQEFSVGRFPSPMLLTDQSLRKSTDVIRKSILTEIDKLNRSGRR